MEKRPRTYVIQSVKNAAEVLNAVARMKKEVSPTELGQELHINKVKAYRYLNSLKEAGLIYQNPETGKYRLSWSLIYLGNCALESSDISRIALPHMRKLSAETGETIILHVWDRGEVVVANMARSSAMVNIQSEIGSRIPVLSTAAGRALLAFLPLKERREFLRHAVARGHVENKGQIEDELNEIRRQGWAFVNDALIEGISALSVPVFGSAGDVLAAITLVGTSRSLSTKGVDKLRAALVYTAREISRDLGWAAPEAEGI